MQNTISSYDVGAKLLRRISWLVPFTLIFAALGVQMEWWTYSGGLSVMKWTTLLGVAIALFSFVGFVFFIIKSDGQNQKRVLAAFVLSFVPILFILHQEYLMKARPAIHDITTDFTHPPLFFAVLPQGLSSDHSSNYLGGLISKEQTSFYPEVQPLVLEGTPKEVFQKVLRLVHRNRWELIQEDEAHYQIQAVAKSFWLGLKDDVIIRITPEGKESRVDMRSVSRSGENDGGVNAERIETFMQKLAVIHNQEKARQAS